MLASSQLPLNYAGFGLVPPSELEDVKRRVAAAREELRQISVVDTTTDASGKKTSVMMEAGSQEARELDQAIDRMMDLQDTGLYGYGETIRLGDIIPLYNQRTGQIILGRMVNIGSGDRQTFYQLFLFLPAINHRSVSCCGSVTPPACLKAPEACFYTGF